MLDEQTLYDPFDARIQSDPYPVYRVLRDEYPVYRADASNTWVLSRYDDVVAALLDHGCYSSAKGIVPTPKGLEMTEVVLPMMIMTDPPRHDVLRALVSRAFTPRRVAGLEPSIQELADTLVGQVEDIGYCDFVQDIAGPLPAMVIADLIGVPREDRDQFKRWSTAMVEADQTQEGISSVMAAAGALYGYFATFLADRRRTPREDLISALVEAEIDDERLTDDELLGFCLMLLVAGHETTTNLLGNSAVVLAQHPEARDRLTRERALVGPAVEELLRYDSPVQGLSRTLTREVTLHDTTMNTGDTVLLLFGSANRDERAFPAPDIFDIDRKPERQVAFGRGAHFCLGAALARMEARIVIEAVLDRLPNWEVDLAAAKRLRSGPIRGYGSLPITWLPH